MKTYSIIATYPIYLFCILTHIVGCSNKWHDTAAEKQVDAMLENALLGMDIKTSESSSMSLNWKLSSCPITYNYHHKSYIRKSEINPEDEARDFEFENENEWRANVIVQDNHKSGQRHLSVKGFNRHLKDNIWQYRTPEESDSVTLSTDGKKWKTRDTSSERQTI